LVARERDTRFARASAAEEAEIDSSSVAEAGNMNQEGTRVDIAQGRVVALDVGKAVAGTRAEDRHPEARASYLEA